MYQPRLLGAHILHYNAILQSDSYSHLHRTRCTCTTLAPRTGTSVCRTCLEAGAPNRGGESQPPLNFGWGVEHLSTLPDFEKIFIMGGGGSQRTFFEDMSTFFLHDILRALQILLTVRLSGYV